LEQKALMIIAPKLFRDEEYSVPKTILENGGIIVTTASKTSGTAEGRFGLKAQINLTLDQVRVSDYDAILFIGGAGSRAYFDDPLALKIAREAKRPKKILASICSAGGILANAGVLEGKKATSFSAEGPLLISRGAHYSGAPLEIDKSEDSIIITADGPEHADIFGEIILQELNNAK